LPVLESVEKVSSMKPNERNRSLVPFLVAVACAAWFVWLSSRALPDVVASHFDASGRVNGWMPRAVYRGFMLALVVLVPVVLGVLPNWMLRNPNARINLPNPEYWLAQAHRAETIDFISRQLMRFAFMLLTFLCYTHWLVVRANEAVPPQLSSQGLTGGLVIFLLATVGWVMLFLGHFRRTPR